jgi:hypothetical protein
MKAQPTVSPSPDSCSPSNIDAFKASLLPLLDEIAVVSREATQLSALPDDRVAELSTQSTTLYNKIAATQAPDCLEGARDAALEGASLLVQAIGSIASRDYPQAESSLRASFESVAQAAAIIAIQTWEATATSTPAH